MTSMTDKKNENEQVISTPSPRQPGSFRLLTHNVWCHYLTIRPAPDKVSRMTVLGPLLGAYDVALFQELFCSKAGPLLWDEAKRALLQGASREGLSHVFDSDPPPFLGMNSGLVIASRFEGRKVEEICFTSAFDLGVRKGFLEAEVFVPVQGGGGAVTMTTTKSIRLITVHLDAHFAESRAAQIAALKEHILKSEEGGGGGGGGGESPDKDNSSRSKKIVSKPTVVAGDFNICPFFNVDEHQNLIKEFESIGFEDLFKENPRTFRANGSRLDYIFINSSSPGAWGKPPSELEVVDLKDQNGNILSDHKGLAATLFL